MEYHIYAHSTPKSFYENGCQFLEAAWRCFGGKEGKIIQNGKIIILPVPTVVNASFACEMFFKALLLFENKSYEKGRDGHNLKKLFQLLDIDIQQKISNYCMPKDSKDPFDSFIKILDIHSTDFAKKRYYIENSGWTDMSPITMITIAQNLSIVTNNLLSNATGGK